MTRLVKANFCEVLKEKSFLYKLLRRGLEIKRKYRNRLARLKKWNIVVPLKTNIP
jgi:hypothetical protein